MKSRSLLRSPRIHSVRSTAIDKFISHDQTLPPKTFIRTFTHCVRAIRIFSRVSQTKLTKLLQKSRYSMNTRTLASTHSTWRWNGRRSEKNGRTYRIDAVWMRKAKQSIHFYWNVNCVSVFGVCVWRRRRRRRARADPLCTCVLCNHWTVAARDCSFANGRSSRSSAAHTIVLFDAPTISMKTARNTVKPAYRPNRIAWRCWNYIYIL